MTPLDWSNPSVRNGILRMLSLRSELLAQGHTAVGWKLGFGAPAALERFDLEGPLVGFLTSATVVWPGDTVSCEGWKRPVAEPEIAVYIGSEVRQGHVGESIAGIGAAIELANVDPPPDDIEEILAGDIFHEAVLFGEPDWTRAGGDRSGLNARVVHDGREILNSADMELLTGEMIDIVGHASALLNAAGEGFSSGDVVIIGSITPPLAIEPGQEIEFELSPLPAISVTV